MKIIHVDQAEANLPKLIEHVAAGDVVLVGRGKMALVRLVPSSRSPRGAFTPRSMLPRTRTPAGQPR